jgi:hypothetical protein
LRGLFFLSFAFRAQFVLRGALGFVSGVSSFPSVDQAIGL